MDGDLSPEAEPKLRIYVNSHAKMSRGKYAAAAVHAALMAAGVHPDIPVIVLGATKDEIAKLGTQIVDAGRTEIDPGTLTAGTDWSPESKSLVDSTPVDTFRPRHSNIIDVTISEDGLRKMCALCVEFKTRAELFTDKQGVTWDVCEDCAKRENMDSDDDDDASFSFLSDGSVDPESIVWGSDMTKPFDASGPI